MANKATSLEDERKFLACCFADADNIDYGLQHGLTLSHFIDPKHRSMWEIMLALRMDSQPTDPYSVYAAAKTNGRVNEVGGLEGLIEASKLEGTSIEAKRFAQILLDTHAKREAYKLFTLGVKTLKDQTSDIGQIREIAEKVVAQTSKQETHTRTIKEIADEAVRDATQEIEGKVDTSKWITTGLPTFDHRASPIKPHEYVVIGARTSHGKSSFLTQVAGHNLMKGLKVAYFTLETSDTSVVKQMAAQVAKVNIRRLAQEPRDRQQQYVALLHQLRDSPNLMIFQRDLSLEQIAARCRMLAASWKPDLVCLDYIGLIGVDGQSGYERMSRVSKAMIPLKKSLGCALLAAAQFNRGPEAEARPPTRSDFRDSGNLEEDAHRIIAIHRLPNQDYDSVVFQSDILQLKCRDGALASSKCVFNAAHTRFYEEAATVMPS